MTVTPTVRADTDESAGHYQPLGPDSLFWQITGDWRGGLLAGRVLILQVAHPVVGAGVGEHSVYKTDPYGRLDRTMRSTLTQVFGGAAANEEGARLRQLHRDIKGIDAQGRRYSALHPEAYLWVHATGFEFALVFFEKFGTPLDATQREKLFQEWRTVGWTLGIPEHQIPASQGEFWEFWKSVTPKLENNPVVQDLLFNGAKPPPHMPRLVHEAVTDRVLESRRQFTAWTLPPELREAFGLPTPTVQQERRMSRQCAALRIAGERLPKRLLFIPLAWEARERAITQNRQQAA
jgi:uncharacterized protein (DUF2236 family)